MMGTDDKGIWPEAQPDIEQPSETPVQTRVSKLKQSELFQNLPLKLTNQIIRDTNFLTYKDGEMISFQRPEMQGMIMVLSGWVSAKLTTGSGRNVVLATFTAGQSFQICVETNNTSVDVEFVAHQDIEVAHISKSRLEYWKEKEPQVHVNSLALMAKDIRQLDERIFELMSMKVEERLRLELTRLFKEQKQFQTGGILDPAPGHAEIAHAIGANREAISRGMSNLNQSGIIESKRRWILLLKPEELTLS